MMTTCPHSAKFLASVSVLLVCLLLASHAGAAERVLFNRAWKFHPGDGTGCETPTFDDAPWQNVDLPHDFRIEGFKGAKPETMEGPFDPAASRGEGYLNNGPATYRKTFTLPASWHCKHVTLYVEGAYMNAEVWLNGQRLGNRPYGFSSFYFALTSNLKPAGESNVLAVKFNNARQTCRWYPGGGLYRDVWLIVGDPVRLDVWGTSVTTPKVSTEVASVELEHEIRNDRNSTAQITVTDTIIDPDGKSVGSASHVMKIDVGASIKVALPIIDIKQPRLWSLGSPSLYSVRTEIKESEQVLDREQTTFGVRSFRFSKDDGFWLNGKRVQIQGVCNHESYGPLGAAVYPRAVERQLQLLKTMGCNAIRTSHNPPAPVLLELCDKLGFLVMDEAFDEWKYTKGKTGSYSRYFDDWSQRDLESMIRRDRNHPSIVLWSIGNEIPEGAFVQPNAESMATRLVEICHRADPTRPVTAACNSPANTWKSGLAKPLDVFGINYAVPFYTRNSPEQQATPTTQPTDYDGHRPMIGSETQSETDTRGEYGLELDEKGNVRVNPKPGTQVSSLHGVPGNPVSKVDETFRKLAECPWVAGEWVWTGFDYLGEPTPHSWPARSSYFGIFDICGFPKDRYYQFKAHWTDEPVTHILPHWNWPGFEGKTIPVQVFTNADNVELFLNGRSLGAKNFEPDFPKAAREAKAAKTKWVTCLDWQVPYEAGELKAVGKRAGKVISTDIVKTAGPAAKLTATVDRDRIESGGRDLAYITVRVLDKDGNTCPNADHALKFQLDGDAATLAGLDNGDPTSHEFLQGVSERRAFHGMALAILKSHVDRSGTVTLTVTAEGLQSATVRVSVTPAQATHAIQ